MKVATASSPEIWETGATQRKDKLEMQTTIIVIFLL